MTNKSKLIFATVVVVALATGLLFANHRAAQNAAVLNAVITDHSFHAVNAISKMQFGTARIVSSINELLVLSASRNGPPVKGAFGEKHEHAFIDQGNKIFNDSFSVFKENHKWLNPVNIDAYAASIAEIEQLYVALQATASKIMVLATQPFDPLSIAEIKETFEGNEQDLLKAIKMVQDLAQDDNNTLIVAETSVTEHMETLTIVLWSIFILVVITYSLFVLNVLSNEEKAHHRAALAVKEKDQEMQRRIELERVISHSNKLESLGTLASGMAHELNNQLLPVMTMAELVLDRMEKSNPEHRKMELVLASASNAKKTVSKILEFSRISGEMIGACEVAEVCRATKDVLEATCAANIRLTMDVDKHIGIVNIAKDDLQGVILNLCSNAFDSLGALAGDVAFEGSVIELDGTTDLSRLPVGTYAKISVRDTGSGMNANVRDRIFDPFFTTKPVGCGVGIGLSIVYRMIKQAGGEIQVESEQGQGSTFTVYLPLLKTYNNRT